MGRIDEAIALYRRAIEIDPLQPRFYYYIGLVLNCAGRQEEAATYLMKALELAPEMQIVHAVLGRVYLMQSRSREALVEMEKEKHPLVGGAGESCLRAEEGIRR